RIAGNADTGYQELPVAGAIDWSYAEIRLPFTEPTRVGRGDIQLYVHRLAHDGNRACTLEQIGIAGRRDRGDERARRRGRTFVDAEAAIIERANLGPGIAGRAVGFENAIAGVGMDSRAQHTVVGSIQSIKDEAVLAATGNIIRV